MTMKTRAEFLANPVRVQIPAYTDRWMMGDRYGQIVSVKERKMLDPRSSCIARVKLDKSGKTVSVFLDDCTNV
jgi:hypothetical protein